MHWLEFGCMYGANMKKWKDEENIVIDNKITHNLKFKELNPYLLGIPFY